MIGYIVLIIIVYLSLKYSVNVKKNIVIFKENGISVYLLGFSSLLYIISVLAFLFSFSWLTGLGQLILTYLLILPGVSYGYVVSSKMNKVGLDKAAKSGSLAESIMWLGVGLVVYITGSILIALVLNP